VTTESYPQLELDRQLCFPLYAAARAVVRAYGPLLADVGLTYPQYLVMMAMWGARGEAMTVGDVGRRVQLDTGTLTPLLKRLETAGHLRRRRDPGDERRVLLELTQQGWDLRERVAHVPGDLFRTMKLDRGEIDVLRGLLSRLVDHLGDDDVDQPGDPVAV
jgi:MarR family transcriptional regulator, organic hydroperoxide resistance regulator